MAFRKLGCHSKAAAKAARRIAEIAEKAYPLSRERTQSCPKNTAQPACRACAGRQVPMAPAALPAGADDDNAKGSRLIARSFGLAMPPPSLLLSTSCSKRACCPPPRSRWTTPAPVLDPGRGRTKTGYFWAIARDDRPWQGPEPPSVAYTYAPGRGAVHALKLRDNYTGIVQCDGYAAYKTLTDSAPQSRPRGQHPVLRRDDVEALAFIGANLVHRGTAAGAERYFRELPSRRYAASAPAARRGWRALQRHARSFWRSWSGLPRPQ
jgi:hypothetical protein